MTEKYMIEIGLDKAKIDPIWRIRTRPLNDTQIAIILGFVKSLMEAES